MTDVALSELIGLLYDAAIDPEKWQSAVDRIRSHFGFQLAVLGILSIQPRRAVIQVSSNVPQSAIDRLNDFGDEIPECWGGVAAINRMPLEEPLLNTDVTPFAKIAENRFYREWAKPLGLVDQVVIMLSNDRTMIANLSLGIHEDGQRPSPEQFAALRLLAPHIRRAATISNLLDLSANMSSTFTAAFDAMSAGAVLVDAQLRIVYANAAGTQMLELSDPIRSDNGRLQIASEVVPGQLEAALTIAVRSEADLERRGLGIPALRRDGSALVVHVMPLARRNSRLGAPSDAVAAVFIADGAADQIIPIDAAMALYSLTPAEARVFELIASGSPNENVARELGIAPSTVRTHLVRVFSKTGRHDRSGLARLAAELRLPV